MANKYSVGPAGTISAPRALPEFPHPRDFDGKDPFNARDVRSVFAKAPWFDRHAFRDESLIERYVRAGVLPGGIPWEALETYEWEHRCVASDSELRGGEPAFQRQVRWVTMIYKRLRRTAGDELVDPELELDTWVYRTAGEAAYACRLAALDTRRWRGLTGVNQEAQCFEAPILRAEFRYLRKNDISFWSTNIRWERNVRNRLGFLASHQMVEIDLLKPFARVRRYVSLTRHWFVIEVPLGCIAELPAVSTYLGSYLRQDANSGLWVVVYTEWSARVAAYLLWHVYDNYRLWYIPPTLRGYIRSLELSLPLGSQANFREVLELLDVLDEIDWEQVPEEQRKRGTARRVEHSPGRCGRGGDFIWYDPWTKTKVSAEQARELRANPREMPDGHPYGYVYEPDVAQFAKEAADGEEEPDLEMDDDDIRDSEAEAPGVSASTETRAGYARLDSRGTPLATPAKAQEMEIIIKFLCEAGCNPLELVGGYAELQKYASERMTAAKRALERKESRQTEAGPSSGRPERYRRNGGESPPHKRR